MINSTKYALNGLLSEFGQTYPADFITRILRISRPYISFVTKNGIIYSTKNYVIDALDTILYHSGHGSTIEEIEGEIQHLIENIEVLNLNSEVIIN